MKVVFDTLDAKEWWEATQARLPYPSLTFALIALHEVKKQMAEIGCDMPNYTNMHRLHSALAYIAPNQINTESVSMMDTLLAGEPITDTVWRGYLSQVGHFCSQAEAYLASLGKVS